MPIHRWIEQSVSLTTLWLSLFSESIVAYESVTQTNHYGSVTRPQDQSIVSICALRRQRGASCTLSSILRRETDASQKSRSIEKKKIQKTAGVFERRGKILICAYRGITNNCNSFFKLKRFFCYDKHRNVYTYTTTLFLHGSNRENQ